MKIKSNDKDFRKNYKIGKCIGRGSYGEVFEGYMTADPTVKVAVKVLDKKNMDFEDI